MPLSPTISLDSILPQLQLLIQEPSVAGHTRTLDDVIEALMSVLRGGGLDCQRIATAGAPIVLGRLDVGAERTLLLYSHYDVAPAGPRRSWATDPFRLTERDGIAYGRGIVAKAELVAQVVALNALLSVGILPFNVCLVIEGEHLLGSPHLQTVAEHLPALAGALWSGGSLDGQGRPLLYTGTKGLLQAELRADGARLALPQTYAASMINPVWTLTWALASIKSEFEEVLLEGFYDDVMPPNREEVRALQTIDVGEQARRDAWNISRFAVNLSGPLLPRTESFSPTCNISAFEVQASDTPAIPSRASATLQFHLVPDQQPDSIWQQLVDHLAQREFISLQAHRLPGSYAPHASGDSAFWNTAATNAVAEIYGAPGQLVTMSPFVAPASLLAADVPLLAVGLERPTSALFGPNEQVPLADVQRYAQLIAELILQAAV